MTPGTAESTWPMVGRTRDRPLIPFPAIKEPASAPRSSTPDLLEKERHPGRDALIANRPNPVGRNRSPARTAFSPDDDPVDSGERQGREWRQKRLNRQEAQGGR